MYVPICRHACTYLYVGMLVNICVKNAVGELTQTHNHATLVTISTSWRDLSDDDDVDVCHH